MDLRLRKIVASYVGAWIETLNTNSANAGITVASYVGAWIETVLQINPEVNSKSHPMWVRGLKLYTHQGAYLDA